MRLAFGLGDIDQGHLVDLGRTAQQRACDDDLIVAHQHGNELGRRIDQFSQPLGQHAARVDFGLRDQAGEDAVEQVHVGRLKPGRALQEQVGNLPDRLAAARGIAVADDFLKPRNEGFGLCHQEYSTTPITKARSA